MKNFSYILKQTTSSLFSLKDLYKITHDSKGRLYPLRNLKPSMQKKLTYNNKHLSLGMSYTEENGIPILQPYNGNIDFSLYPFYEHKKNIMGMEQLFTFSLMIISFIMPLLTNSNRQHTRSLITITYLPRLFPIR